MNFVNVTDLKNNSEDLVMFLCVSDIITKCVQLHYSFRDISRDLRL